MVSAARAGVQTSYRPSNRCRGRDGSSERQRARPARGQQPGRRGAERSEAGLDGTPAKWLLPTPASTRPGMPDPPPRPAPSPEEIASRANRTAFNRATLAEWGVPWPPPAGWRRELERRHAEGLTVQPIEGAPPKGQKRGRRPGAAPGEAPKAPTSGTREPDGQVSVRDVGPIDPANPPPWLD